MAAVLYWITLIALVVNVECSTLYGYYTNAHASGLVSIDPQTGAAQDVCDLSALPPLSGGSTSSYEAVGGVGGLLLFYDININGNISLVQIDPATCKSSSTLITGLASGQDDVRDIKYDRVNNMLYMVFPNPFCMHGSLDQVNLKTASVISHLTNVGDPVGLSQTAGIDGKSGGYYFVGIPVGVASADVQYQLNIVNLTTGNVTATNLVNNNLDVGDMWGSNYTLNVVETSSGPLVVGAVTPDTTTVKECSPSGFYSINTTTGDVNCAFGPIQYEVFPLAEFDPTTNYYYQLFNDANYNFYLYTFDTSSQKVVYSTACKVCSQISVLTAL